jgi:hypothetical protein
MRRISIELTPASLARPRLRSTAPRGERPATGASCAINLVLALSHAQSQNRYPLKRSNSLYEREIARSTARHLARNYVNGL